MNSNDHALRWIGRLFQYSALVGLAIFGGYILLRSVGVTFQNFEQWHELLSGASLRAGEWFAALGIGLHYFMGAVLVLAWPILFSSRIRARHRLVHRWTGRIYVTAGLLAGAGGLTFILARHTGTWDHTAFAIWGAIMMLSAVMAYAHARAKRFDLHRAWAIRLFAMVLGSWIFDLYFRAWADLAGGVGFGDGTNRGWFDYVIAYFFFVPNLLVAEFFIRNQHRRAGRSRLSTWSLIAAAAAVCGVFVYSIVAVSGSETGKYGKHLLRLFAG